MLKLGSDLILDAQKIARDWNWGPGPGTSVDSLFWVFTLHQRLKIETWDWTITPLLGDSEKLDVCQKLELRIFLWNINEVLFSWRHLDSIRG